MLIVPILVDVFKQLKNESAWEDYCEKRWHRNIVKALTKIGVDYNEDTAKDFEGFKYAQMLLANPTLKGLTAIPMLGNVEDEE